MSARCSAVHPAKAFRVNPIRSVFEPALLIRDVALLCRLHEGHAGPHECMLPKEAGDDAGKVFQWPEGARCEESP